MATSQPLGLESYVAGRPYEAGRPPEFVSVHAEPLSWVVVVHNKKSGMTVAGYFKDPKESEKFTAMQLPISDDRDLSGLEVRLLGVKPRKESDASVADQTFEQQWSNEKYLKVVFEGAGIQPQSVKTRYARGSKLVRVNMSTGKLQVRNALENGKPLEDDWRPPEPTDMYPAYPLEPADSESHDPPEPNKERFGT